MKSQNKEILKHLISGYIINPLYALDKFGCFRLGARIWDLKKLGYTIISNPIKVSNNKYVASYTLGGKHNKNTPKS